jgi:hypothetical protein
MRGARRSTSTFESPFWGVLAIPGAGATALSCGGGRVGVVDGSMEMMPEGGLEGAEFCVCATAADTQTAAISASPDNKDFMIDPFTIFGAIDRETRSSLAVMP